MRVIVGGTYGGDTPIANGFWVRNGTAIRPSASDFDSLVKAVGDTFVLRFKGLTSNSMAWTTASGYYYDIGGIALASSVPITGTGSVTAGHPPANVAACIGWRVSQHYKGGHPRTYLVGPDMAQIVGGRSFSATFVTGARDLANQFLADVNNFSAGNVGSVHLGVVSFQLKKQWRDPPVFRDFVPGGAHVDTRVDSQRRRLGRDVPP